MTKRGEKLEWDTYESSTDTIIWLNQAISEFPNAYQLIPRLIKKGLGATCVVLIACTVLSQTAEAGIFDLVARALGKGEASAQAVPEKSVLTMPVLESAGNPRGKAIGPDIVIEDNTLVSEATPSGEVLDVVKPEADSISVYEVRTGDTLSEIADMFGVSVNTIRWANDISAGIRPGQVLTILPVSGIRYTVKKGDTVASIAKAYKADAEEINRFNDISGPLASGQVIIIPDAEAATVAITTASGSTAGGNVSAAAYFTRPVNGGRRTQGIHGHNGVDIASYRGAPILAAASGEVIISRADGSWNGGYGNYVVVKHGNGTQTLYAHLDKVSVSAGSRVTKGDQLGTMGNTGKSTGVHLHFEVRGAKNPF